MQKHNGTKYAVAAAVAVIVAIMVSPLALVFASGQCSNQTTVTPPGADTQTAGQIVRYFESQGLTANAAAGITGNLQQENGFSPVTNGGGIGIAQWDPGRGAAMQTWAAQNGLDASTRAAQLAYIVYDLKTHYATLLAQMNAAPDPGAAAVLFQNVYEQCGNCVQANRVSNAIAALKAAGGASNGGTSLPVAAAIEGDCAFAATGDGRNPIPDPPWHESRDDAGVDASAPVGAPIFAPADSTLVAIDPKWTGPFDGLPVQPLLLFHFDQRQADTYAGCQFWYVAEEITPVTTTIGTDFKQGQPVAHFAPSGSGIEIGWGSPTAGSKTFAEQQGDPGAMSPPPGTTVWGETFKKWAGMTKWIGTSP